jgi:hypothetical protein
MSGSKGDSLIVKKQVSVVVRMPLLLVASTELKCTGDPEVARVESNNLVSAMNDAAVSHPRASEGDRNDIALRGYAITRRRGHS